MRECQREASVNYFDESLFKVEDSLGKADIQEVLPSRDMISDRMVAGRIIGVSSDSSYKRLLVRKVFDKCNYHQKMSDVCNTIIVRSKSGDEVEDVHICLYGQMAGGIAELKVGAVLEAEGKFDSRNRFMARQICVDSVKMCTQFEMSDFLLWITPTVLLLMCVLLYVLIDGMSALIIENQIFMKIIIFFLGGFWVTLRGIKKVFKYYLPFGMRMKMSVIGGIVSSVIFMTIF